MYENIYAKNMKNIYAGPGPGPGPKANFGPGPAPGPKAWRDMARHARTWSWLSKTSMGLRQKVLPWDSSRTIGNVTSSDS